MYFIYIQPVSDPLRKTDTKPRAQLCLYEQCKLLWGFSFAYSKGGCFVEEWYIWKFNRNYTYNWNPFMNEKIYWWELLCLQRLNVCLKLYIKHVCLNATPRNINEDIALCGMKSLLGLILCNMYKFFVW